MPLERGMARLATRERIGEQGSDAILDLGRKVVQRLILAIELEAVVLQGSSERERPVLPARIVDHFARPAGCITLHELGRDLRTLDRRARNTESVSEVAKLPGDRSPAATHARL